MMRTKVWLAAIALGALALVMSSSACVSSNQGEGSEVAKAGDDDSGEGEIVCRTERPTGSNIAQRVCYNRREAEERREADQQGLRESGSGGCTGPGCSGGD
jgi:hypothetical protein